MHRVQRVPVTESQGRIHTSAATVAVLPEAEEIDIEDRSQRPRDRRLPLERSRAGSRSTRPTPRSGSPTCRPGSSSPARTRRASSRTRRRRCGSCGRGCSQVEKERQEAELADARRSQVASGGRSEKIRTYNFKENRVTDHRVGVTLHSLEPVLAGGAGSEIVDALAADERRRQLRFGGSPERRRGANCGPRPTERLVERRWRRPASRPGGLLEAVRASTRPSSAGRGRAAGDLHSPGTESRR